MRKIGSKLFFAVILCITILGVWFIVNETENIAENAKIMTEERKALVKKDTCYQYYYEQLNDEKKSLYEQIYEGVVNRKEKITVNQLGEDSIYEVAILVSYDHPELYYYDGSCTYLGSEKSQIIFEYSKSDMSEAQIKKALATTLEEVYASIPDNASDYDKTRIVYEYIIERCEYDEKAQNNQNILSSLVENKTVCAGYAKGIQYILRDMGIPCSYIVGKDIMSETNEDVSHAWNMVVLDNDYYYLDATWGDVVENMPHICYGYYMMSQKEMLALYAPDKDTKETTNYNNYFIQNDFYLNAYDENKIGDNISQAYQEGREVIEIKCDPSIYADVENQLVQNERIYKIMDAKGLYFDEIYYTASPELNLIEIILN